MGYGKILVVDDEPLRNIIADFMQEKGYIVETAHDGLKALEIIRDKKNINKPFDLIITDIMMPNLDGNQLIAELRANYPSSTQVIFMSGYPSVDSSLQAIKNQAFDFILKPFQIKQLMEIVKKAIEKKRAIDSQSEQVKSLGNLVLTQEKQQHFLFQKYKFTRLILAGIAVATLVGASAYVLLQNIR